MYYLMLPNQDLYPMITLETNLRNKSWVTGQPLNEKITSLEFKFDSSLQKDISWCDFFRPAANIPLFSKRMKDWMEKSGVNNIEFYKASIKDVSTNEERLYYAGNIIGQVRGVDSKKSQYELFDEDSFLVEEFEKLYLIDENFKDVKICRLAEYDLLIVAHELLKSAYESNHGLGVRFLAPERWDGFST